MIRALWDHRSFVASLVRRDFQLRSARAVWGSAWLVIQPAAQILIYTVLFAEVLKARLPGVDDSLGYGLYLCAGLLTWSAFSELVLRCQNLFLEHAGILKTIAFPRSTLPAALWISSCLHFVVVALLFLGVLWWIDRWPGWALLGAVPLLLLQSVLALSIGILAGTLHVFFRDVGQIVGVGMQFWFWLTPIVYPLALVPERFQWALTLNPLFPLVSGYQRIIIEHAMPVWEPVLAVAILTALLALTAWTTFRTVGADLVEEL